ncbi:MAG: bifunctional 3'-5' exonuclease/DNA polymerase, partial [Actinobacteria bacterium]|nr:bifunctional 3'-5' exonuclease/DNA polymerase [Actinomycetota bacterium]
VAPDPPEEPKPAQEPTLFDLETAPRRRRTAPEALSEAVLEFDRQRAAIAGSTRPGRLALLLAAESAGALVAAELSAAGVPWDAEEHDRLLTEALGPRPAPGARPERLAAVGELVRRELGDPSASLDSPPKLLRSLRAAGIEVSSTSRWELSEHEHPAIPPLLQYKRLARLLAANGWGWLDEWVHEGRYRPVYVPGGVVTGRWASSGGGALQLPRQLRPALRADPGWLLVSADVSQLEPRVLAAMSGDRAMAAAGAGKDLYAGIVESGAVSSRQEAKIAVLGAMYGATTGDSGRLVPRLRRAYPAAMRLVDEAAEVGEHGGIVTTWLGRSSPAPGPRWTEAQAAASLPEATRRDEEYARRISRDWGRFTRNFVVQGTAAEWALAWMAELRLRLADFDPVPVEAGASASGPVFSRRPHLAFFLHDEVIVHTPRQHAEAVAREVEASAQTAGRRLFGDAPVDFRLDLRISERAVKE